MSVKAPENRHLVSCPPLPPPESVVERPSSNPTLGNPSFAAASARVLVLRLSPWRDVAASSPHLFLAQAVRRALPDTFLDFAFLPPAAERRRLHAAGRPLIAGIQSRQGLAAFDLVLVSNSFLIETVNLPALLLDAGLPVWSCNRPAAAPAVVLGGSNACASHCLVRPDGHAVPDAIFFGEGDDAVAPFLRAWHAAAGQAKRPRLLAAAATADGFWVAGATERVRQAVATGEPDPPLAPFPLLNGDAADTVRLPASRGCPCFCAFCFEGFERKPYREIPAASLLDHARRLKAASGARAVELDAFTLNTHAGLAPLVVGLSRLFERVSCKSQRVDLLARQPALVPLELAAGKRSFTLGIEGVSARLRAFLNKSLADDDIDAAVRQLLTAAVREIKLFYLITGHETEADLAEFRGFLQRLASWRAGPRRPTRVIFSFGYLVRMPRTPLRHDRLFLERAPLERLAGALERLCTRAGGEFRLASTWSEYQATQLLAAGDHRLAPIVAALAADGWLYDGSPPDAYARRLQEALAAAGLLDAAFAQPKPRGHRFPFDFLDSPVGADFLWRQYEAAAAARDTGYCLGDTCRTCGACADDAARGSLARHPRVPDMPASAAAEAAALVRAKQRLPPLFLRVRLDPSFSLAAPEWTSARLLQLLLAACPEEADNVLSVEEALFTAPATRERFPVPAGETVVAVKAWDPSRVAWPPAERVSPFVPGAFAAAAWQVLTALPPQAAENALAAWLRAARLPFTLRREPDGAARFDPAPAALRKGIVLAAACRADGGRTCVSLTLAPKADLLALLRELPPIVEHGAVTCTRLTLR
jgi:hypothetical protein